MKERIAIVGGGILGLAHAWIARHFGHEVTLFDRTPHAQGATVRNFGMIWPIGQWNGPLQTVALRSRSWWLQAAEASNCWLRRCGSLHLAHHEDELAVLEEFCDRHRSDAAPFEMMRPEDVHRQTDGANPEGLLGGLWSPLELGVNPRHAARRLAAQLQADGVTLHRPVEVKRIVIEQDPSDQPAVAVLSDKAAPQQKFHRAVLCTGADIRSLYPEAYAESGIRLCKLQMLRTEPQPKGWKLGTHLASGLTLRHYANFSDCPSLSQVQQRIASESPELDTFGVHVMASQDDQAKLILGDSHEYGEMAESPFDKQQINDLILRELRKVVRFPNVSIEQTWHGVYGKHPDGVFTAALSSNVLLCTGVGGAGMTLSFGIAERNLRQLGVIPDED